MSYETRCQHGDIFFILVERPERFLTAINKCKQKNGTLVEHIDAAGYQIISNCKNSLKEYWIGLIYNQNFCHHDPNKTFSWFTERSQTCRSPSPLTISNPIRSRSCQAVTIRPVSTNITTPFARVYPCDIPKSFICQIKNPAQSVTTPTITRITTKSYMDLSSTAEQLYSTTKQVDLKNDAFVQRVTDSTSLATIIGPAAGGALILLLLLVFIACWLAKKKNNKTLNNRTSNTGETVSTDLQPIYFSPDLNSEEYVRDEAHVAPNPIYNVSSNIESPSNNEALFYELVEETKPKLPPKRNNSTFASTSNYEVEQNNCYDELNVHQRASKKYRASYQKAQEAINIIEEPEASCNQSENMSILQGSSSSLRNDVDDITK